jgi:hypothetical protein
MVAIFDMGDAMVKVISVLRVTVDNRCQQCAAPMPIAVLGTVQGG